MSIYEVLTLFDTNKDYRYSLLLPLYRSVNYRTYITFLMNIHCELIVTYIHT